MLQNLAVIVKEYEFILNNTWYKKQLFFFVYLTYKLINQLNMNSKVIMVIRIVFGILIAIFGANKFYPFMPAPTEMPEGIMNYMSALMTTKTIYLVGAVELIAGLSLIFNKYTALMMIILMSVSVNAVLFHATMAPEGIGPALLLLILNVIMLFAYKDKYKDLLKG